MLTGIVANLLADLIWAPAGWLAYRWWRAEAARHRDDVEQMKRRVENILGIDEEPSGRRRA